MQLRQGAQDPYGIAPIHLSVEILSPEDRIAAVFAKCHLYHEWGTINTWIVDPQSGRAWQNVKGSEPQEILAEGELLAGEIHIYLSDILAFLG